jgi:pimeloyl-ACP methyl ester carboxylesterase
MRVVLVPGLLCDAAVFAPQLTALGPDHDVVVASSTGAATIEALATTALRSTPGDLAVVGHSLGGRIAFEMVRQAPERITHLAVLDTGVHPASPGEVDSRGALVRRAREDGMASLVEAWLLPMLHPSHRDVAPILDPLVAMLERNTPDSFARQQQALLTRPDAAPHLAAIDVPTLVLVGAQDAWSPVAQHVEIAAAIAGSELDVVERCGHMSTVEQPAAVNAALRRLLAR